MRPDHAHPTIADVAERAGVSTATVSRVLNGSDPVLPATAERVRRAVAQLGYVPQTAARNLAARKTNTIGLLLPDVDSDFYFPILRGIDLAARQAGFDLLIAIHTPLGTGAHKGPGSPLGKHNADGLLVYGGELGTPPQRALERLAGASFPAVLLYHSAPAGSHFSSVMVENRSGAYQAVQHLIAAHSRQRIAFLRGPQDNEDSQQRELGYRRALEAHGLAFDPALTATGGFNEGLAAAAVRAWLQAGTAFDAIFAADDESASGALAALQTAGVRVPEQVALVGFDDSPLARHLTPALTTVRAPAEQVGREAVNELLERIRSARPAREIRLPTELVVRRSCGCEGSYP